jgi:pimeloyl-ACP methyl ester carboxylesterase
MPFLNRPDSRLAYQTYGSGFPVLLFAPGGLRSRMDMWSSPFGSPPRPWVDWTQALPTAGFKAIAMDQRNAGRSQAEIRADHGWHTYAADHLALMDHLGFQRFHVLGGCIGGSFCLKVVEMAPHRVTAAVLQNPIGLHSEHPEYFPDSHAAWGLEQREARPELDYGAVEAFGQNMWNRDFVFSVDRSFARTCPVPTMLLPGSDTPHPAAISAELAGLLPGVEVLTDWRGPEHLVTQEARVVAFLQRHTPDR